MKHLLLVASLIVITTFPLPVNAEPNDEPGDDNYCTDESSWHEWHALLEKHPDDDAIYSLYALRLGLCSMVESGAIDKERAINIFERMRDTVIQFHQERGSNQERKNDGRLNLT